MAFLLLNIGVLSGEITLINTTGLAKVINFCTVFVAPHDAVRHIPLELKDTDFGQIG